MGFRNDASGWRSDRAGYKFGWKARMTVGVSGRSGFKSGWKT
jgi:hypothetical protein